MRRRPAAPQPAERPPPGEHRSVLLDEVLHWLRPRAGGLYLDGTVGNGGHAAAILEHSGPDGRLLGLDADPDAVTVARQRLAEYGARATVVNASFREMARVVEEQRLGPV